MSEPVDIDAIIASLPEFDDPNPPHPSECALWHMVETERHDPWPEVSYGAMARAAAMVSGDPDWMNVTRWPRVASARLVELVPNPFAEEGS